MKEWWAARDERERLILLAGGGVLAAVLLWVLAWEPLVESRDRLRGDVVRLETDHEFMQRAVQQVAAARAAPRSAKPRGADSLLGFLDRSARERGLGNALRRAEPVGDDAVRLWFDDANFDQLIMWLEFLNRDYGIVPSEVAVSRGERIGILSGRLTLVEQ